MTNSSGPSAVYGNGQYAAAIELLIGARSDPEMHARIKVFRSLGVKVAKQHWANAMSDIRLPARQLSDILHLVVASMRGLSLHFAVADSSDFHARQLRPLRDFLVGALHGNAHAGDARQPIRPRQSAAGTARRHDTAGPAAEGEKAQHNNALAVAPKGRTPVGGAIADSDHHAAAFFMYDALRTSRKHGRRCGTVSCFMC